MNKKSLKKIGLSVEKINYLYRNLRDEKYISRPLELRLLKQYTGELYDALLDLEQQIVQPTHTHTSNVEDTELSQLEQQPPVTEDSLKEGMMEDELDMIGIPKVESQHIDDLLKNSESLQNELDLNSILELEDKLSSSELNPNITAEAANVDTTPTGEISFTLPEESKLFTNSIKGKSTDNESLTDEDITDTADQIPPDDNTVMIPNMEIPILKKEKGGDKIKEKYTTKTEVLDHLFEPKKTVTNEESELPEEDKTVALELNDILAKQQNKKQQPSIVDKLSQDKSNDLSISFNQRFAFVNQLFKGDNEAFNKSISELNKTGDYIKALAYVNLNLRHKYSWKDSDPTVKEFLDMIRNKFLG